MKNIFIVVLLGIMALNFAAPSVPCGNYSTPNIVLTMNESIYSGGSDCINITGVNTTLNCANFNINGGNSSIGIYVDTAENVSIYNCNVTNYSLNVFLYRSNYSVIENLTAFDTYDGGLKIDRSCFGNISNVFLNSSSQSAMRGEQSNYTKITNLSAYSNSTSGTLRLDENMLFVNVSNSFIYGKLPVEIIASVVYPKHCIFKNNTFYGTDVSYPDVEFGSTTSVNTNNTFYWNNFTGTPSKYVSSTAINYYNSTEGNIWGDVMNGSVAIAGTISSAGFPSLYIGSSGVGYPYSNNTSIMVIDGNVVDYAPLTPFSGLPCNCSHSFAAGETCTLSDNVNISGATCLNVTAENITIDCANFTITGNNSTNTIGIYSNQPNTSILNCQISNFSSGIILTTSTNGRIENTSATTTAAFDGISNGIGILLNKTNFTTVSNTNATANTVVAWAMKLDTGYNNTFNNIKYFSKTGGVGFFLLSSWNNLITNSSVTNLTSMSFGGNNTFLNITMNVISGTNALTITGSTNNLIANSWLNSTFDTIYFVTGSTNNTVENSSVWASGDGVNFVSGSSYNTVRNVTTSTVYIAATSHYNNISNTTTIGDTTTGEYSVLIKEGSKGNRISNSTIHSPTKYGVKILTTTTYDNWFINNTFIATNGNGTHVWLDSDAYDNVFYWNNFTNSTNLYINDTNGSNYYNKTEGNVWENVINGSINITSAPTVLSNYMTGLYVGNNGTGYPYNITNTAKFSCNFVGCGDYAPITNINTTGSTTNTSEIQVGIATANNSVHWSVNMSTTHTLTTCNYNITKLALTTNTTIKDAIGSTIPNGGNYTNVSFNCSSVNSSYQIDFYTEPVVDYLELVSYSGIVGSNQLRYLLASKYNQSISFNFTVDSLPSDGGWYLYNCSGVTNATCVNGGVFSTTGYTSAGTSLFKTLSLVTNETVVITTYNTITGGGGGGEIIIIPPETESNLTNITINNTNITELCNQSQGLYYCTQTGTCMDANTWIFNCSNYINQTNITVGQVLGGSGGSQTVVVQTITVIVEKFIEPFVEESSQAKEISSAVGFLLNSMFNLFRITIAGIALFIPLLVMLIFFIYYEYSKKKQTMWSTFSILAIGLIIVVYVI